MNDLKLFVPLSKIDEEKRLVYGIATAEQPDRSGEVCDYETTKPYYQKWSDTIHKASDGRSLGNLRAMHGKVAAGKIQDIIFDDDNKRIEICAKVVDDNEWKKVLEGVYTGFSQGGAYVKRWNDEENPAVKRYTANPTEVSLVDLPCLPTATFQLVKADGLVEERHFAKYSDDQQRDEHGRWTAGDAAVHGAKAAGALAVAAAVHYASPMLRSLGSKALIAAGTTLANSGGGIHMAIVKTAVGLAFTHFLTKGLQEAILAAGGGKVDSDTAHSVSVGLQAAHSVAGVFKSAAQAEELISTHGPKVIDQFATKLIEEVNNAEDITDDVKRATIVEIKLRAKEAKAGLTLKKSVLIEDVDGSLEAVAKNIAAANKDNESNWQDYAEYARDGILDTLAKYSEDQPRDENGRWTGAAAAGAIGAVTGALVGGIPGAIMGGVGGAVAGYKQDGDVVRASIAGFAGGLGGGITGAVLRSSGTAVANTVFAPVAPMTEEAHRAAQRAAGIDPEQVKSQWKAAAQIAGEKYKANVAALAASRASRARITAKYGNPTDLVKTILLSAGVAESNMLAKEISIMTIKKPTNDEIAAHAVTLAKAAGDESNWVDFIEKASEELNKAAETPVIANRTTVTDPASTEEVTIEKTADAVVENPTSTDEVEQMWLAKDGKAFKKKAEALAHNEELKKVAPKVESPTLASLEKLEATLGVKKGGDETTTENQPSVMRFVKALLGDDLTKYAGEEIWDAGRAMTALSACFDLLMREMSEDESMPEQVAALKTAIASLKAFIVSEIQEDNTEVGKFVVELQNVLTKSLEKGTMSKEQMMQVIHDHSKNLGADCGAEKHEHTGDLSKVSAHRDELQKALDGIAPRIDELVEKFNEQTKKVEEQAAELAALKKTAVPPPVLRVVSKGEENGGVGISTANTELEKAFNALSPEEKALVMVKAAQKVPQHLS